MFIAAQLTIAKTWELYKKLSTDKWIKKKCFICTMDYYSVIKENEIMPFAATWMDLDIVFLSQTEKDKYLISFICRI